MNGKRKALCGVYCFLHRDSGRCYIGSSRDILDRKREHLKYSLEGDTNHFRRQLRTLGHDSFNFEIVELCEREKLLKREKFFIQFFDSARNGFNTAKDPTLGYDHIHSDVTRARMSVTRKGVKLSDEHSAKISAANRGRKWSLKF